MCGIMAYTGKKQAFPILIDGLKKLEYRGYDSSGVAVMNGSLSVLKQKGIVDDLVRYSENKKTGGNIGLGHTRWATHGEPTTINAHPHQSQSGNLTVVHNGIIENHQALKDMLIRKGYTFQSDTDTEVIVQLLEWYQNEYKIDSQLALCRALDMLEGSFALVLFDKRNPERLLTSRRQCPLVIGIGDQEFYISSDPLAISPYTRSVVYLDEDVIAVLNSNGTQEYITKDEMPCEQEVFQLSEEYKNASKGEFENYMLKEIHDQEESVHTLLANVLDQNRIQFPGLREQIKDVDRVVITACGTSWHSALIAEYYLEQYAKINVEVEYASEFRYRNPLLSSRDLIIGMSQSGETADTLAALELAKESGCKTMAFVNVPNSSIARLVDQSYNIYSGPEISVASTKAFTSQVTAMLLFSMAVAKERHTCSLIQINQVIHALNDLPSLIDEVLKLNLQVRNIAAKIWQKDHTLFIGRGTLYPLALEGALKLKEISYIHAEGYPAGELKHGPIALVDDQMPAVCLVNNDHSLQKTLSNIQEIKARKAQIIIVKNKSVEIPAGLAERTIEIPDCPDFLNPILQIIPLQLLAYHVANMRGCNVDKPRNLAKSVTVE